MKIIKNKQPNYQTKNKDINNKHLYKGQEFEERTLQFAQDVIAFVRSIKKDMYNQNIIFQLLKSSSSIGANYIEANEGLSKKDAIHRLRISRKEARETLFWLKMFSDQLDLKDELGKLIEETRQIIKILSTMITKTTEK